MPAWIRVRLVAGLERRSGGATREVWLGNRDWMLRLNWLVIFYGLLDLGVEICTWSAMSRVAGMDPSVEFRLAP